MTALEAPELLVDDRSMAQKLIEPLAQLPEAEREAMLAEAIAGLSDSDLEVLLSWDGQGRPSQRVDPTGDALLVALMGGRGAGKTRAGSEAVCDRIEADMLHNGAFVSRTPGDVRRVMIEGKGGFMEACERRGIKAVHTPSRTEIRIVDGGTIGTFTAHAPESIRGNEFDTVWGDEYAAWPTKVDELGGTAFSNLLLALRLGQHPLGIFTTTPRATPAVKQIMNDRSGLWRIARMSTMANASNLAPGFIPQLMRMFGGSRLFAQEVLGLYVEDVEGALWSTARIEGSRLHPGDHHVNPELDWASYLVGLGTETDRLQAKIALAEQISGGIPWRYVAVDPSFADDGGGDECGIVVGGVGLDGRFYVFGDYSGHMSMEGWAQRVSWAYHTAGCSYAVVEGNMAQSSVATTIANVDPTIPIDWVHARQGKRARAEPVSVLWKEDPAQSIGVFVGSMPGLEAECTGWDARSNVSPNRIDALAWLGWKCFDHLFTADGGWSAGWGAGQPLPL